MSHFILVCDREGPPSGDRAREVERCARLLWPAGVVARPTRLLTRDGLVLAVVDPSEAVEVREAGVCLGQFFGGAGEWWRPGGPRPDGNYVLCRTSREAAEIVTDLSGSRSAWYYHDDDVFLAASAQRPLIALLRSFRLHPEAATWMVTSRSLGPLASYDARLRQAPLDGVVRLDRTTWTVSSHERWEPYSEEARSDAEHVRLLNEALVETCSHIAPAADRWPVLLSGGYDSRSVLLSMRQAGAAPPCVTWGLRASLEDPSTDAFVARQLARATGVPHEYYALDETSASAARAIDEFVVRSEGQVVNFTMYIDAFETWQILRDRGYLGVLRGDNYPWAYLGEFDLPRDVRWHVGMHFLAEYAPGHAVHKLGLPAQTWPAALELRDGEDLLTYRDRLQHYAYIPKRVAPLNQIKAGYVEVLNPMQARRVAAVVAAMPERLRLHPGVLRQLTTQVGPDVPFATRSAATDALRRPGMREAIATGLSNGTAARLYAEAGLGQVLAGLAGPIPPGGTGSLRTVAAKLVPRRLRGRARGVVGPRLGTLTLAFRMLVAARAVDLFEADAKLLSD